MLAPNRKSAQILLDLCEKFAMENNIKFSTHPEPRKSKSKAMFVVGKVAGVVSPPAPLHLCGQELPWVSRCEHLGVTLTINGTLEQDCREKRASFIDNSVKIRESFSFAHPLEMITAVEKYCNSFYGSNLWCFDSPEVESIFSAWRTNIKLCWNIPRWSHNYFIDTNLAPHLWPLKSNLLSRFFSFFLSLLNSDSTEVQVVARLAARDLRSNVGSNLSLIKDISGLDPWETTANAMKSRLRQVLVSLAPEHDWWKVSYLDKLLTLKMTAFYYGDEELHENTQALISSLIVN